MQRTLLASVIMLSLSACDGGMLSKDSDPIKNETPPIDPTVVTPDTSADSGSNSGTVTTGTGTTGTGNSGTGTGTGGISDDAGSSTSDGGETSSGNNSSDNDASGNNSGGGIFVANPGNDDDKDYDDDDSSGTNGGSTSGNSDNNEDDKYDDDDADDSATTTPVNDDSGSSTSDGGETPSDNGDVNDDSGSSTSDGGETTTDNSGVNDDSGSSTSDGGETTTDNGGVNDDSGSSTSDGGNNTDTTDNSSNTDNNSNDDFASDNIGGSILRRSTLSSTSQLNICTTASDQQNFSDMRVGDFILHNNAWRPWRAFPGYEWEQCIYSNTNGAVVGWNYDWGPGQTGINGSTSPSGDFYVRSYPELIYGVKDEFRTSAPPSETGFPIELGQMPNISIDYAYDGPQYGESRTVDASNNPRFPNGTTISGERNVAIESFFYNKDSAGQCSEGIVTRNGGSNHVYEVMVWLDAGAERLPAGPSDFVTNLTIRGDAYKVYTKSSDPRYIAFVAQNPQNSGTIYWNDFIDWAKDNAHQVQARFGARSNSVQIQDDWCIANIIVGTEIFWGAGNLDIYDWTITQSR